MKSWFMLSLNFSSMTFFSWNFLTMAITKTPKNSEILSLQDWKTSIWEHLIILGQRQCTLLPLQMKKWECLQVLDKLCLNLTKHHVFTKTWLARQRQPILFLGRIFHRTCMSKLDSLSSRRTFLETCLTINMLDTCTILDVLRLFNLSILSLKQGLFNRLGRVQRLELKLLESKFRNFKLLLSYLWVKFQTDKFSAKVSCKSHFHHTSKL